MPKTEELIIKDFNKGIGLSPHVGFGSMRNVDVHSVPGVVRINNILEKKSSTTVTDLVNWIVRSPYNSQHIFALDDEGNFYRSINSGDTWSLVGAIGGSGNGLAVWKNYAVIADDSFLNLWGPLDTAVATSASFVGSTDDTITVNSAYGDANLVTGRAFRVSGGSLPTGFSAGTTYWMRRSTTLTIWAYPTEADANADTNRIDITGSGSGTIQSWDFIEDFVNIDDDADWHPLLVSSNDGKLYAGAGRYIASLEETLGDTFDPDDAASYSFVARALDLPANYRVKCLAELGENLMIGTWWGTGVSQFKVADIFPWPRTGPSFGTPLHLQRHGVHAMTSINNLLYILAGIYGEVLVSNGVQAEVAGKVPDELFTSDIGGFVVPSPGGITNHKNRLFFTLSQQAISTNVPNGAGVWSLQNNVLVCEDTPSSGFVASENLELGALCSINNNQYLLGWNAPTETAAAGIDAKNNQSKYTSYTAFIETPFYKVGTNLQPFTFSDLEFQLAKPLVSGEGVRIKYRINLTDSFTTIGTFDFATLGGITSHNTVPTIPTCEFVQLRIELTADSTTSPELRTVTLR